MPQLAAKTQCHCGGVLLNWRGWKLGIACRRESSLTCVTMAATKCWITPNPLPHGFECLRLLLLQAVSTATTSSLSDSALTVQFVANSVTPAYINIPSVVEYLTLTGECMACTFQKMRLITTVVAVDAVRRRQAAEPFWKQSNGPLNGFEDLHFSPCLVISVCFYVVGCGRARLISGWEHGFPS
jgi:hypothetical protein